MATKREIKDFDTIYPEIRSNLNAKTKDAEIWLQTLKILGEENPSYKLGKLIEILLSEKYRDGKALIINWNTPINELPITLFFPRVVFNPEFYNSEAYLTNISRSLQKFFFPHFIVEAVSDYPKNRLSIKFKTNIDKRKKFTPSKDSMPEFHFITNFPIEDLKLNGWLEKWSATTMDESQVDLVPRSVEFFRENLVCAVLAVRDGVLLGAAGMVYIKDANEEHVYFEGKKIVEFVSNVVFEGRKYYATIFVEMRLSFVRDMDLFPIVVTKNINMLKILKKYGSPVEEMPEKYWILKSKGKGCDCKKKDMQNCKFCPIAYKVLSAFYPIHLENMTN